MKRVRKATSADGVRAVNLDARSLVTIDSIHPLWQWAVDWHETGSIVIDVKDAIVRLQPPAHANDQQIAAVKKHLMDSGAAIVRADSRAQAATMLVNKGDKVVEVLKVTAREMCMQMAETSSRKEELKALLDLELLKAGL